MKKKEKQTKTEKQSKTKNQTLPPPQKKPNIKPECLYGSWKIPWWPRNYCPKSKTFVLLYAYKDFTWVPVPVKPPNTDTQLILPAQTPLVWIIDTLVVKELLWM